MFLAEIFTQQEEFEDQRSPGEDESKQHKSDTRKTRLTLAHINKLRIMNDARRVEQETKIKEIQQQYKLPAEDTGM